MGTLGQYLREAREARGIDLREAAQQTRIGLNFLKALEQEDFAKLPGEVFVKGFLKNYGKFLHLSESELMKRYAELQPSKTGPVAAVAAQQPVVVESAPQKAAGFPVEPFIWGTGIMIILVIFLFTALPTRRPQREVKQEAPQPQAGQLEPVPVAPAPEKLYLEVVALENTWLLIRTDNSPQKNATLKKGESLIWSAGERFLLSFGSAGAIKLLLNGQELIVDEQKNTVVRDMEITTTGIVNKKIQPEGIKKPRIKKPEIAGEQLKPAMQSVQSTTNAAVRKPQQRQDSAVPQTPRQDQKPSAR